MLKGFKDFIMRGNVIDLAVGVVIGGAFGKLVEGVVKGIIEPVLAAVQQRKFDGEAMLAGVLNFGGGVLNFLLLAAVVFFVFVKPMNKLKAISERKKGETPPPPAPADVVLLTEIRDLLKK